MTNQSKRRRILRELNEVQFRNEALVPLKKKGCEKVRESANLQQAMNFRLGKKSFLILMSVRPNAPYRDRYKDDGAMKVP